MPRRHEHDGEELDVEAELEEEDEDKDKEAQDEEEEEEYKEDSDGEGSESDDPDLERDDPKALRKLFDAEVRSLSRLCFFSVAHLTRRSPSSSTMTPSMLATTIQRLKRDVWDPRRATLHVPPLPAM